MQDSAGHMKHCDSVLVRLEFMQMLLAVKLMPAYGAWHSCAAAQMCKLQATRATDMAAHTMSFWFEGSMWKVWISALLKQQTVLDAIQQHSMLCCNG
jgi:hypothetical protein